MPYGNSRDSNTSHITNERVSAEAKAYATKLKDDKPKIVVCGGGVMELFRKTSKPANPIDMLCNSMEVVVNNKLCKRDELRVMYREDYEFYLATQKYLKEPKPERQADDEN